MKTDIFINIAVKDLQKAKAFFSTLGFTYNMQFSDEKAACMILNEQAYVMLLQENFFKGFTRKEIVNAHRSTEVLLAISADSREGVNEFVDKAIALGATEAVEPQDHGFMFSRSFSDLDGHIWEVIWMDMEAFNKG